MKNFIFAVCILLTTSAFGQQGFRLQPDVRAKPDKRDTLTYTVIVYDTPKSILKDVIMENEYLKSYVSDKKDVKIVYDLMYSGAATVNEKYRDYVEVLELKIISH